MMDSKPMLRTTLAVAGVALAGAACSEDAVPPRVTNVTVVSAADSILAAGRSAQFTATALDAGGQPQTVVFAWQSSNPVAAQVDANGMVQALATGSTAIAASVPAEGGVQGALTIRVVNADLTTVTTLSGDAFPAALVTALSPAAKPAAQVSWALCATHAGDGNIVAIRRCVAELRAQGVAAPDATDRMLLALLGVFGDHIEQRLAL